MAYLDSIFGSQTTLMQKALTKTAQRQASLMTNLSNVNVPGYKRQEVDFSVSLDDALAKPDEPKFTPRGPQTTGSGSGLRQDGNNVDMEHEMVSIAETENHFSAVSELTSRYFGGLKTVIKEGR